jgi:hypothetical protein
MTWRRARQRGAAERSAAHVRIDRLVIRGAALQPTQREELRAALVAELGEAVGGRRIELSVRAGVVPRAAATVPPAGDGMAGLGRAIAAGVARGIEADG